MCKSNVEQERDQFALALAKITDKYISEVARVRFQLVLHLQNGYLDPNGLDTDSLIREAEAQIAEAKNRMDEETNFLIHQHFLY